MGLFSTPTPCPTTRNPPPLTAHQPHLPPTLISRTSSHARPQTFTIYFPPAAEKGPVPVVFYLSGLTCTDENFIQKAGACAMF